MRILFAGIAAFLTFAVFWTHGAPPADGSLLVALAAACLAEALGVRLLYYGTVSFGLVVYAPLLAKPELGPSSALAVALAALLVRELLVYSTSKRMIDELLLEVTPLAMACLTPLLLRPNDPDLILWLAACLTYISTRGIGIRFFKAGLTSNGKEMVKRLQEATADLRWGVLGLALLAIPLSQGETPLVMLALLPVLYSLRKAAIHAYAHLDKEDKKALRSTAGQLSKTLRGARTRITGLHAALETTGAERDLLFALSRETVGCASLIELLMIVEKKARSLGLGDKVEMVVRDAPGWIYLQTNGAADAVASRLESRQLPPGFHECLQGKGNTPSVYKGGSRRFHALPGLGALSLQPAEPAHANSSDTGVFSLFCSQVSLACLSARRFEVVTKTMDQLAVVNKDLESRNTTLVELTRALQRISACQDLLEACALLPETGRLLLGHGLHSVTVEAPDQVVFLWEAEGTWQAPNRSETLTLAQEHRLIFACCGEGNPNAASSEAVQVGLHSVKEILSQILLGRSLKAALEKLRESEASLIQSAKLAAIGELSAGLAHEINNPLASIRLGIEMTIRKETISQFSKGLLEKGLIAVQRAETIIGSLLSYSRSGNRGKVQVSAWDVLFDTCAFLSASLRVQDVKLQIPLRGEEVFLLANPQELQQILTNLLLNAKDALQDHKPGQVVVHTRLGPGLEFHIEVHDSGAGIPEEVKDRIFDPFFTTKPVGKGTGLGLSVSREMATAQGGQLEAEASQLLSGACFRLSLPVLAQQSLQEPTEGQIYR